MDLLNRKPSNDGRCITFSVKEGMHKNFEHTFRSLFSSCYKLYSKEEAINLGLFGLPDDKRHERIDSFLGDYVAIAISKYYFNYKDADNFEFKSHHAGITKREMLVPICVYKK